jgi:anion-transporting  ArsA/GET3 family ATPase
VLVPVGSEGRLWAVMVDMAESWDRLVRTVAPDDDTVDRLLANELYRTLTRRFIQSHDYIALDRLLDLEDDNRYDLVIIDTPPSGHAIDLLDAPGRMVELFDSRLLRWLTAGGGGGLVGAASRPFQVVAQRLLGDQFLGRIVEFFTLFARLRPRFVERIRRLETRLTAPDTCYAVVTTTDPVVVDNSQALLAGLAERGRSADLVLVNRLDPTLRLEPTPRLEPTGAAPEDGPEGFVLTRRHVGDPASVGAEIADPELADAVARLIERAESARLPLVPGGVPLPVVAVPLTAGDLTDLDGLDRLLRTPGDGESA